MKKIETNNILTVNTITYIVKRHIFEYHMYIFCTLKTSKTAKYFTVNI